LIEASDIPQYYLCVLLFQPGHLPVLFRGDRDPAAVQPEVPTPQTPHCESPWGSRLSSRTGGGGGERWGPVGAPRRGGAGGGGGEKALLYTVSQ